MIISRTPFRISFFGGGTDYKPWFQEHGGAVLSTTFNRYSYISCRYLPPFFDYRNRIVWSRIETVNDYDEIIHPVVREVLRMMKVHNIEIHHEGDLPSRSGLGSSSSFTVGLLNSLYKLTNLETDHESLAKMAIYVEQTLLKENVGVQDQIAVAHGGLNRIDIAQDASYKVTPVDISTERVGQLQDSLMLFYTGTSRMASDIAGDKIRMIPEKTQELHQMKQMVDEGVSILEGSGDIVDFGRLLNESWKIKRTLSSKVAPAFVDDIYQDALAAGAVGGKLLGAGGGGFMLFFVPPENQQSVLTALDHLLVVPIRFEYSGSKIIFCDPDHYSRSSLAGKSFTRPAGTQ